MISWYLIICSLCMFPSLDATFSSMESISGEQKEVEEIDRELALLEKKLAEYRSLALNAQMKAQPFQLYNWDEFIDEIQLSEEEERRIMLIKERIKYLESRKSSLLKKFPSDL